MATVPQEKLIARARDRVRYAEKVGKAPRPDDLKLLERWRAVRKAEPRPDGGASHAGPTRGNPEIPSAGAPSAEEMSAMPPPSTTDAGLGGAIPELPAPDVSASSAGPEAGQTNNPEGTSSAAGADPGPSPAASGPAPDAAGALPALYRGLLVGLNEAARKRSCWFTLPEASIDVLTAYAAEVLAPYEAVINKPALVLGAPVILGVQILVHDGIEKSKKQKAERAARMAAGEPAPEPVRPSSTSNGASTAPPPPPAPEPERAPPLRGPAGWQTA